MTNPLPWPITDHQAKYYAWELKKRHPIDQPERFAGVVANAQVDLNPHQVEAALFAFHTPLSRGAILADEVGLGKTIEAGLVLSQRWAERRRKMLIITPANLRKQWHQELQDKFFLPCVILESATYKELRAKGITNPLEQKEIVIVSYHFAKAKHEEIAALDWDLVVIDEAHRLRNVYKPSNKIANIIKTAIQPFHKILLTATPLQNSLLELYGLVSIIDEHVFGDFKSFRDQFANPKNPGIFEALKARLREVCHRTLRNQVTHSIKYTRRTPIVREFTPSEAEQQLYELVTEYLRRPVLNALPSGQRSLITLILRKLLASSSFAIAGAIETMLNRLRTELDGKGKAVLEAALDQDYEHLDEVEEEWSKEDSEAIDNDNGAIDREAYLGEIEELQTYLNLARSIEQNQKGLQLLSGLQVAFEQTVALGGVRKAIIFTESRRTQDYLLKLLTTKDYKQEEIVLFNGTNADPRSRAIYQEWIKRHEGTDRVTGSKTADMRAAIVDYFKETAVIMIATEAGAEGINLQFCSLVVNYDLPWNPQRVEQRIGRCHRYGQKQDVVVLNFINNRNEADKRVYQLLNDKFQLFEGVFGASDEVLGAITSGVDFEKRIAEIYQNCRTQAEIQAEFDRLQEELREEIDTEMQHTRQRLLENFDDDVIAKLRQVGDRTKAALEQHERILMTLTRHMLGGIADFDETGFDLQALPNDGHDGPEGVAIGRYELPRRSQEAHTYRPEHPLAQWVRDEAIDMPTPVFEIQFSLSKHPGRREALADYFEHTGWLMLKAMSVNAMGIDEDHLLTAAFSDFGGDLDREHVEAMLNLPATVGDYVDEASEAAKAAKARLVSLIAPQYLDILAAVEKRNSDFFDKEVNKLERWADDRKGQLEKDLKEKDREISEAKRKSTTSLPLAEKIEAQKLVKALEAERNKLRRDLYEMQDRIDADRDDLIAKVEDKMLQSGTDDTLFWIRWRIV